MLDLLEGVPPDHICAEKAFHPLHSKLQCSVNKDNDVMCVVICDDGYYLDTGDQIKSNFPFFICNQDLVWTHLREITASPLDTSLFKCVRSDIE